MIFWHESTYPTIPSNLLGSLGSIMSTGVRFKFWARLKHCVDIPAIRLVLGHVLPLVFGTTKRTWYGCRRPHETSQERPSAIPAHRADSWTTPAQLTVRSARKAPGFTASETSVVDFFGEGVFKHLQYLYKYVTCKDTDMYMISVPITMYACMYTMYL